MNGGKGSLTESIDESIKDKAVCRTAPVTLGLLNTERILHCKTHLLLPINIIKIAMDKESEVYMVVYNQLG